MGWKKVSVQVKTLGKDHSKEMRFQANNRRFCSRMERNWIQMVRRML